MSTLHYNIWCSRYPNCPKGDWCPFGHSGEEQMWNLFQRSSLCPDADCKDNYSCPYSHNQKELEVKHKERTSFCITPNCARKHCVYAHSENEKVPIYNFCKDRSCKNKNCKLLHPKEPKTRKSIKPFLVFPEEDEEEELNFEKLSLNQEEISDEARDMANKLNVDLTKYGAINTATCICLKLIDGEWCFPHIRKTDKDENSAVTVSKLLNKAIDINSQGSFKDRDTFYYKVNQDIGPNSGCRWFCYSELLFLPLHKDVFDYLKTL